MPTRLWIHLAELTIALLLALAIYFSWRADHRDRSQLESELAVTKQLLAAVDGGSTIATLNWRKRSPLWRPKSAPS